MVLFVSLRSGFHLLLGVVQHLGYIDKRRLLSAFAGDLDLETVHSAVGVTNVVGASGSPERIHLNGVATVMYCT